MVRSVQRIQKPHLFDSLDLFTQLYAAPSGVLTSLFTHAVGPPYNNFLKINQDTLVLTKLHKTMNAFRKREQLNLSFSAVGWLQPQPPTNKT